MIGYGIIQADGTILEEDNNTHYLPFRGTDNEGYPEVLMDAETVGGEGFFYRQSIKPFIGMKVSFQYNIGSFGRFNHVIIKE